MVMNTSLLVVWFNSLTNSGGELHVWHHDGDTLGVFSAKLGINEQVDEIVFSGFLESLDGKTLETDVVLVVVLNKFTDELGEWELTDQKIGGLLILLDFSSGDCTLLGTSDLLDTLAGTSGLTDGLTGDSLTWSLGGGGGFTCGMFGSSHCTLMKKVGWSLLMRCYWLQFCDVFVPFFVCPLILYTTPTSTLNTNTVLSEKSQWYGQQYDYKYTSKYTAVSHHYQANAQIRPTNTWVSPENSGQAHLQATCILAFGNKKHLYVLFTEHVSSYSVIQQ
ncbi:Conserved_hypothetical protein [Hexamita inflata]|uniref:Uncharacterized protein n=1 Tax=Hexamita inflata TaxID=28002 RepID=A0AA86N9M4_9EUKA|nr:Conserved hypothetical protein [Hexamita inflata]